MDLSFSHSEEAFRDECRHWLRANTPHGLPSGDTRDGFAKHLEWEKLLFENGYSAVSWPTEYGGRGASLWEWLIFEEEYYAVGAPQRVTQNGIFLLAPSIFEFGSQDQKNRYLKKMAAAEQLWCQGWSEPDAGSDLAGVRSRAERVEGGWKLHGQKTWTTRGAFCTHLFGLFRTDPESTRHHGLTYMLVPLDIDGVEVRGFGRLDGDEGFAEVFFDGAFVSDDDVLGEVGKGWSVAMATTSSERGLTLRSPGRFTAAVANLLSLTKTQLEAHNQSVSHDYIYSIDSSADIISPTPGAETLADGTLDQVVAAWMGAEAYRLYTLADVTGIVQKRPPGARSSLNKIFWSELDIAISRAALEIEGSEAECDVDGWMKAYQFALAGPIYAGTNEIQRNIVAERVLGLPRK